MKALGGVGALVLVVAAAGPAFADVLELEVGGFVVAKTYELAASPRDVYDAMTGDVSAWWDHTFSDSPRALYIEPKPGGGFYEIFDESGDGVKHGEVIWAERGKMLKLRGPLEFSGKALDLVHTFTLEEVEGGTRLRLSVHAAGETEAGWPEAVDRVWDHFIDERLRSFLAGDLPAE